MSLPAAYGDAVASLAQERIRQDLTSGGFAPLNVTVVYEDDDFVFVFARGEQQRVWRWRATDDVYHFAPDGTDPDEHSVWLYLLAEEENTDFVHRR